MKKMTLGFVLYVMFVFVAAQTPPAETRPLPTVAARTAGMERVAGYFPYYWDARAGKIWLEVDRWNQEFLYVNYLSAGLGSNDVGLDRGQIGATRVVRFERVGPRVLLAQPNYSFRAVTDSADERRAVEESFAQSVLWGFDAAAEDGTRVLIDATAFLLRDAHNIPAVLRRTNQGAFRLDGTRSVLHLPRIKNFPRNTEFESTLTFAGDDPGGFVSQVTPTNEAITIRQHHSLVELPGPGFKPRVFDPRAGYFPFSYYDYATPVGEPVVKRFVQRHRLEKKDPSAAVSEPVKPIVYYLDRGAPEPIRSALLDGARWWNQAFEAAGYRNAFRVELLPEDADPLDVRYNMIQWVHRATRGWSYGSTVTDPRTGEIIKGHVTLGSLRVRQDYLIAEGLLSPYNPDGSIAPTMSQMALARLSQLSAHEVGHTLGLSHNYIASTINRASVMDYPPPLVKLAADGLIDLSDAYATGIGDWDKVAITYGYRGFASGADERRELNSLLTQAAARGLSFLSDQDARPPSSAHPAAHLWDSGSNAVDELRRTLQVRAAALRRFSENAIRLGAPLATLEEALVPVYMFHRYQAEAASKVIGGLTYGYSLRGSGGPAAEIVPADEQRRALAAVLETLQPETLTLPEELVRLIPPRPIGYGRNRELFRVRTGLTFDPISAAEAAAAFTLGFILNPERCARLVEYHARDPRMPGLAEVIDRLLAATWKAGEKPGLQGEVRRAVNSTVLYQLMGLAASDRASPQVRATAALKVDQLRGWMAAQLPAAADEARRASLSFAVSQIRQFQDNPRQFQLVRPLDPPDGPPIGVSDYFMEECGWGGTVGSGQ
ncbi:MAG: zinc-dependent metalloprotease [Acidobacteriota bacterium]